jgi:hypothetical protein
LEFVKWVLVNFIAQIALATKQEGAAGGTDTAISWGVGILTGIALATLASTPIGIAMVVPANCCICPTCRTFLFGSKCNLSNA